jgi:predicted nucleic acid-binding protein
MALELPEGATCFVDSNILYYALVPTPGISEHCLTLIDRTMAGRLSLFVSVPVLSDTIHKVMISEVAQMEARDRAGIVGFLGRHPEVIKRLTEYPKAMDRLSSIPMNILPIDWQLLLDATRLGVQHGLLTNDAMIVALMHRHQLAHLVTNDDDFDAVPGLTIWKPR